jgi:hypothetical protein
LLGVLPRLAAVGCAVRAAGMRRLLGVLPRLSRRRGVSERDHGSAASCAGPRFVHHGWPQMITVP